MKKKELVTITVLVVVTLACAGAFFVTQTLTKQTADATENQAWNQEQVVVPAGETVTLNDATEEAGAVESADGIKRYIKFGWNGDMEVTVQGATFYSDPHAAPDELTNQLAHPMQDESHLLVVEIELNNVSAEPMLSDSDGNLRFTASIFGVPDYELCYFSGATVADGHDYFAFDLPVGSSSTYTLAFLSSISSTRGDSDAISVPSYLEPGADGMRGKYQMELDPTIID